MPGGAWTLARAWHVYIISSSHGAPFQVTKFTYVGPLGAVPQPTLLVQARICNCEPGCTARFAATAAAWSRIRQICHVQVCIPTISVRFVANQHALHPKQIMLSGNVNFKRHVGCTRFSLIITPQCSGIRLASSDRMCEPVKDDCFTCGSEECRSSQTSWPHGRVQYQCGIPKFTNRSHVTLKSLAWCRILLKLCFDYVECPNASTASHIPCSTLWQGFMSNPQEEAATSSKSTKVGTAMGGQRCLL